MPIRMDENVTLVRLYLSKDVNCKIELFENENCLVLVWTDMDTREFYLAQKFTNTFTAHKAFEKHVAHA